MDGDPRGRCWIRVRNPRRTPCRSRSPRLVVVRTASSLSLGKESAPARGPVLCVCVYTWCVRDVRIRHDDDDGDGDEADDEDDEARNVPGRGARSARRGRRVEDGHGRLIMPAGSAARKKSCCCSSSRSSFLIAVFSSA